MALGRPSRRGYFFRVILLPFPRQLLWLATQEAGQLAWDGQAVHSVTGLHGTRWAPAGPVCRHPSVWARVATVVTLTCDLCPPGQPTPSVRNILSTAVFPWSWEARGPSGLSEGGSSVSGWGDHDPHQRRAGLVWGKQESPIRGRGASVLWYSAAPWGQSMNHTGHFKVLAVAVNYVESHR